MARSTGFTPGRLAANGGFIRLILLSCPPANSPATVTGSSFSNDRERVLEATDLVAVIGEQLRLEPKGTEYVGVCPFHDDSRPSMCVVPQKGFYHCFACGAHGNAIDFLINYHRIEFREALENLATRAGIELTRGPRRDEGEVTRRTQVLRANKLAAGFFARMLAADEGAAGREILKDRGITPELAETFGLGVAPDAWSTLADKVAAAVESSREVDGETVPPGDMFEAAGLLRTSSRGTLIDNFRNRLIFPIRDELGRPIAFGARKIDPEDEPKYLNSPESEIFHKGKVLYGLDLASRSIARARTAIVCEGYTDVIALHGFGFTNAVATLGTALTREHANRLARFCDTVILLFDGDNAGRRAADRAVEVFFASEVDIRLCNLPDGLDPDGLLRSEGGPERFQKAIDDSSDALVALVSDFRDRLREAGGVTARQRIVDEALRRLDGLGFDGLAGVRRTFVLDHLAGVLGVPVGMLDRSGPGTARVPSVPVTPEPMPEGSFDAAEPIIRASGRRRRAEEAVLRLLLAEPTFATTPVDLDGKSSTPLDRFAEMQFEDPPCRLAWRMLAEGAAAGTVPDGSDIVAAIEDVGLSRIVAGCFAEGYRELREADAADDGDPIGLLERAVLDLAAAIDRDIVLADRADLASRPMKSAQDAAAALERLRAGGSDPAAIRRRRAGRTGGYLGESRPPDEPPMNFPDEAIPPPSDHESDPSFDHGSS